jgi:hypothetical protein
MVGWSPSASNTRLYYRAKTARTDPNLSPLWRELIELHTSQESLPRCSTSSGRHPRDVPGFRAAVRRARVIAGRPALQRHVRERRRAARGAAVRQHTRHCRPQLRAPGSSRQPEQARRRAPLSPPPRGHVLRRGAGAVPLPDPMARLRGPRDRRPLHRAGEDSSVREEHARHVRELAGATARRHRAAEDAVAAVVLQHQRRGAQGPLPDARPTARCAQAGRAASCPPDTGAGHG